jgi:hypothetical protein
MDLSIEQALDLDRVHKIILLNGIDLLQHHRITKEEKEFSFIQKENFSLNIP